MPNVVELWMRRGRVEWVNSLVIDAAPGDDDEAPTSATRFPVFPVRPRILRVRPARVVLPLGRSLPGLCFFLVTERKRKPECARQ